MAGYWKGRREKSRERGRVLQPSETMELQPQIKNVLKHKGAQRWDTAWKPCIHEPCMQILNPQCLTLKTQALNSKFTAVNEAFPMVISGHLAQKT